VQPWGFSTRFVEAGNFASLSAGRTGRRTSSPPQFGHLPFSTPLAQSLQNVHSNVHIIAFVADGGRSRSQHSQFGRSSSMDPRKICGVDKEARKRFEPRAILRAKTCMKRTIDVEHAAHDAALDKRHDDFGV
jgi:hypothetical protein